MANPLHALKNQIAVVGVGNTAYGSFPDVGDTWKTIYTYAWFIGVAVAAVVYGALMKMRGAAVPAGARA